MEVVKTEGLKIEDEDLSFNSIIRSFYHSLIKNSLINLSSVLIPQLCEACGAKAAVVLLADVLGFVDVEVHSHTLAFGKRVGLTLKRRTAAFAGNYFVFGVGVHLFNSVT